MISSINSGSGVAVSIEPKKLGIEKSSGVEVVVVEVVDNVVGDLMLTKARVYIIFKTRHLSHMYRVFHKDPISLF